LNSRTTGFSEHCYGSHICHITSHRNSSICLFHFRQTLLELWKFTFSITLYCSIFFIDLLGKAKKKILKLDEDIFSSEYEEQARVSSASHLTSSVNPLDFEPQEIGKNGSSRCMSFSSSVD
jgi:hypothetical protein